MFHSKTRSEYLTSQKFQGYIFNSVGSISNVKKYIYILGHQNKKQLCTNEIKFFNTCLTDAILTLTIPIQL